MALQPSLSIPDFTAHTLDLLRIEQDAETAATSELLRTHSARSLQRTGLAILNLVVRNQRTGLGGKTVVALGLDTAVGGAAASKSNATGARGKGGSKTGAKGKVSKRSTAGDDGDADGRLPQHGIKIGDVVGVRVMSGAGGKGPAKKEEDGAEDVTGVVVRVRMSELEVALDEKRRAGDDEAELPGERLWVVKLTNEVTYKRCVNKVIARMGAESADVVNYSMNQTIKRLQAMSESQQTTLVRILFGLGSPSPILTDANGSGESFKWLSESLNDSQKTAVRFALAAREVALIHGPPGTGKTHTLIELIRQLVSRGSRVLVCAPSNIAVDNIVERLAKATTPTAEGRDVKIPLVRVGHPARLLPQVVGHSLDVLAAESDAASLVRDVEKEIDSKRAAIKKTKSGKERRIIYLDIKELRKEYRERQKRVVGELIKSSRVVCTTLHGAGGGNLMNEQFDVVVVDEASQALEASCWIPLLSAKKLVLAGDHLQLPPTVKSLNSNKSENAPKKVAAPKGKHRFNLETTLFDRLLSLHGNTIKRMLTTQYRMHEHIMKFPSAELYEGKLVAADHVKAHLLTDLDHPVQSTDDTSSPLIFYDTQGGSFPEALPTNDDAAKSSILLADSRSNPTEALIVLSHVSALVAAGVHEEDIGVITPYNAQLSLLSQNIRPLYPSVELGTVDGFQGREKEVIVLSLVRSNEDREIGFLGEKRRLNVAMTRPKRQLCVVGDSETVGKGGGSEGFMKRWMAFLEEEADVRYPDAAELYGAVS